MLTLFPNRYYRIYRTDKSVLDFRTLNVVSAVKHLIEVKTKDSEKVGLSELLAEKEWLEIAEIDKLIADLQILSEPFIAN